MLQTNEAHNKSLYTWENCFKTNMGSKNLEHVGFAPSVNHPCEI